MIRAFLRSNVLAWTSISIKDHSKYLGSFIGRLVGGIQWTGAFKKFNGKCLDLEMGEPPLSMSIGQFSGRAVPVLGCLAQLVAPHPPEWLE